MSSGKEQRLRHVTKAGHEQLCVLRVDTARGLMRGGHAAITGDYGAL